jgi:hypothetical protein
MQIEVGIRFQLLPAHISFYHKFTVNVDFVTFEYVLLIKHASIYVNVGIQLATKATQLDWNHSVLGIFTRSIAYMTGGKRGGGFMRGCC